MASGFRWGLCTGSWLRTAVVCFPMRCSPILFGPRGRPSIPGPVIAAVMVLQALECVSDREAIQRLRRDIAWKAAAGLSLSHGGFPPDGVDVVAGRGLGRVRSRSGSSTRCAELWIVAGCWRPGTVGPGLDHFARRGCYPRHGDDDLIADKALPPSDPTGSRPGTGGP